MSRKKPFTPGRYMKPAAGVYAMKRALDSLSRFNVSPVSCRLDTRTRILTLDEGSFLDLISKVVLQEMKMEDPTETPTAKIMRWTAFLNNDPDVVIDCYVVSPHDHMDMTCPF
jgi:hypothetical protein